MSFTALAPFLAHPLEISGHILRFCDDPTLAVSSRASLAFLELSGPILYEHITIRGKQQLEMMIRSEAVLPSIAPFVSPEQIKKFTYIPLDSPTIPPDAYRPISSSAVVVNELVLDLREAQTDDIALDIVLSSFDPLRFRVLAFTRAYGYRWFPVTLNLPPTLPWSQIQQVAFTNAGGSDYLAKFAYLADRSPPLDIVYDFTSSGADEDGLRFLLLDVRDDLIDREANPRDRPIFGAVQLWLDDEEDVALARKWLVGCSCTSLGIGVKSILAS